MSIGFSSAVGVVRMAFDQLLVRLVNGYCRGRRASRTAASFNAETPGRQGCEKPLLAALDHTIRRGTSCRPTSFGSRCFSSAPTIHGRPGLAAWALLTLLSIAPSPDGPAGEAGAECICAARRATPPRCLRWKAGPEKPPSFLLRPASAVVKSALMKAPSRFVFRRLIFTLAVASFATPQAGEV